MTMYEAQVTVKLKKGITDPEGANTLKALHLLGFENVKHAQTNHTFTMQIDGKNETHVKQDVEQMCQRLLTNPVIHEYDICVKKMS